MLFVEQEKVENSQVLFSIAHNKFINLLCVYVYIRLIVQNKGTILLNLLYLKKSVWATAVIASTVIATRVTTATVAAIVATTSAWVSVKSK